MDTENSKSRAQPPPYTVELAGQTTAPGPSTHFNPPYPQQNVFPGTHPEGQHFDPPYPPANVFPGSQPEGTHIDPPYQPPNVFPGSHPVTVQPGPSVHVVVDVPSQFGTKSQFVRCQNCGAQTFTKTESKVTATTHIIAVVLCCLVLWPCAWLPYVCKSCQSTQHYCANCNQYLGERHV